jgi:hypothetical protein
VEEGAGPGPRGLHFSVCPDLRHLDLQTHSLDDTDSESLTVRQHLTVRRAARHFSADRQTGEGVAE